jgi:seryl-tRNA synthetase
MMVARLLVLGVATWLLPRPLLAINEEAMRHREHEMREESEAVANMTLESSLKVVASIPGMSPHVLSFMQESLGARHHSALRQQSQQHLRRTKQQTQSQTATVQDAVQKCSEQIEEASQSWEVENHRCCKQHKQLMEELENLDEEIAQANSQSSTAQGGILKANRKISMLQDRIPGEKDSMKDLREQCELNKQSFESALTSNFEDLDGLDGMDMTDCSGSTFLLLQCKHTHTGQSFLMLNHSVKQSQRYWQAPVVQRLLQGLSSGTSSESAPYFFLQLEGRQDPNECRMEANPECQQIRDRYLLMTSDYEDQGFELQEKLHDNEDNCESKRNEAEANINNAMVQLKQAETSLAEATADYNEAMEASRLKNEERSTFVKNMKHETTKCNKAKGDLVARKNSLLKIRGELRAMNSMTEWDQDCKVSDWTSTECSKSCGKGDRMKYREIITHAQGAGATCPILQMTETCNEQHCPIDCSMGEWGGWSACSAKCGGGVIERVRDINRHSSHGGKPCMESQETQSCNPQACETDCELSAWSPWSACSKDCDSGTTFKVKTIVKSAEGQGTCPKKSSRERLHSKTCNTQPCFQAIDIGKTMKCNTKLDIVMVIDGSASLRTSGWDAMKQATAQIASAMGDDVHMAALLASGPKTRKDYFKCTGQKWPNRKTGSDLGTPDMANDCLISWVDHFSDMSSDRDKVVTDIGNMNWPRGSSLLSEALAMADTELGAGRKDAQAVVLVITDGKPMNKRKVAEMVRRVRTKARLMFMSVTNNAPVWLLRKWASWPVEESLIQVKDFDDLQSASTLNNLISNMCQSIMLD